MSKLLLSEGFAGELQIRISVALQYEPAVWEATNAILAEKLWGKVKMFRIAFVWSGVV